MSTQPNILGINSPRQNPSAKVVGWHYDYQLKIGPLANGATNSRLELQILPGAPFCLRAIGGYDIEPIGGPLLQATQLTGAYLEWTDSQDNYLQTALISTSADWLTGGGNAQYEPVYNQVVYQPGSVISVQITNLSGANWTDPRIVFRGTKLFYGDRIFSPCYPDCYTAIPYQFPITWGVNANEITLAASSTTQNIPMKVTGADFVLRGGMITLDSQGGANTIGDLELRLRDQNDKPYSNDFIHWQWLFSGLPNRPGVWYPEIYLPKDRVLLIDAKQGEALPAQFSLTFTGERIWPKRSS